MTDYNEYLSRLKKAPAGADYGRLLGVIEQKAVRQKRTTRLLLAGALALCLVGAVSYYSLYPYFFGGSETLADYVFEQGDLNGDQVLNYVFTD